MKPLSLEDLERAEELIFPEPNSGCWIWCGYVSPQGYGSFNERRAHRALYEMYKGKIPDGLVLDHKCRVKCCVNPDHLDPVTSHENTLRGVGPTAINAVKTHCVNGHELTHKNTKPRMREGKPRRECRLCQNRMDRQYKLRVLERTREVQHEQR